MKVKTTDRGFQQIIHEEYATEPVVESAIASQSSIINEDYDDAFDRPGSSALWIGGKHHLNREEVRALAGKMLNWCETGRLE